MRPPLLRSTAGLAALSLLFPAHASVHSQHAAEDDPTSGKQTQPLPWYVTAAAIYQVTLKPKTKYWRFDHLSLNAPESESQLRAWKDEGIDAVEIFAPAGGSGRRQPEFCIGRIRPSHLSREAVNFVIDRHRKDPIQ
jgi:hypothetical protein